MKRLSWLALLFALLLSPLLSDAATQKGTTLQSAYVGTGDANGKVFDIAGYTTATFQVSGTFSGTIIPEASLTGASYTVLTCFQMDGTTPVSSFVSTGSWRCNITGHGLLRARVSLYTSGSMTVDVTVTDGGTAITKSPGSGGGGGGGGAPLDYPYWGIGSNSTLQNEVDLSGFTALILNTGGTPSPYLGFSCTNQFPRSLSGIGGTTCQTVTSNYVDGSIAVTGASNNWGDGIRQTFNPNNTNAGTNDGGNATDPTNPQNGDRYYNTTTNKCRYYENGAWVNCITSGGSPTFDQILFGTNTNVLQMGSGGTFQPTGTAFIVATSLRPIITTVNGSPYNALTTDFVLLCDTTAGARVINLPAATNKIMYQFKNLGSNSCTINRAGTDLIDGGTTATLTVQYEAIGLYSDGSSKWNVF